ncbi:hypothetical protein ZTR_03629 [Talaromyces verruculosus]|nr:hypothetical protein ZTR_03629 [Talaromyces verruculosus]
MVNGHQTAPPNLALCVTTQDFEAAAKTVLPNETWVYASSSAASGLSLQSNLDDWSRINFRPRIMRSVSLPNPTRSILGQPGSQPFFVSAMGVLGGQQTVPEAAAGNAFGPALGGRPVPGSLDPGLNWEDLAWITDEWDGPIVLKGIQTVEDVKLAVQHGVQGVLLSNHGGRQIHSAPSALMTLLETRTYYPEAFDKLEIFVDGGLRDGADVLKALCLGATAVGVGRPYFYAMAAYGIEGVEKCTDVLAEEVEITMKMLGVSSLDQLRPEMVNASRLLNEMWQPDIWWNKSKL